MLDFRLEARVFLGHHALCQEYQQGVAVFPDRAYLFPFVIDRFEDTDYAAAPDLAVDDFAGLRVRFRELGLILRLLEPVVMTIAIYPTLPGRQQDIAALGVLLKKLLLPSVPLF